MAEETKKTPQTPEEIAREAQAQAAGGLGEIVLKGITQMKIGLGFEGGIAVVILAIVLDRITQGMADNRKSKKK